MDRNDTIKAKLARIALLVATDGKEDGKEVVSSKGRYKKRNLERAEYEATLPPVTPENVLGLYSRLKAQLISDIEQNGFKEEANPARYPYFEMDIPMDEVSDSTSMKNFGMEVLFVSDNHADMDNGISWGLYVKMMPKDRIGKDENMVPKAQTHHMFGCLKNKTDSGIKEIKIGDHTVIWCIHLHRFGIIRIDGQLYKDRTISDEELNDIRTQCREMIKGNWKSWIDEVVFSESDFENAVNNYNKTYGKP